MRAKTESRVQKLETRAAPYALADALGELAGLLAPCVAMCDLAAAGILEGPFHELYAADAARWGDLDQRASRALGRPVGHPGIEHAQAG